MTNFMIAYFGGKQPTTKDEGKAHMEKWRVWIKGLGDAVVNPGTPLPISKIITSHTVEEDNDPNSMKGFAIIKAETIEEAVKIAQSDPFLAMGGTIRISQMMEMK